MTPKQKAEELFDKMCTNNGDEHHHCTYYVAKKCALIAVDEILKVLNPENWGLEMDSAFEKIEYWTAVKKEIELL